MMPNVPQYPVVVAGLLRAGLVVVNVNPLYTPRELEHQLKDSGAKAIVIIENFATTLQQVLHDGADARRSSWPRWATCWACSRARIVNYVVRKRQEDGAGVRPARRGALQRRDRAGPPRHVQAGQGRARTTSRCCSTPAAPPASARARCCCIATSSPTCCSPTPGTSRR